MATAPAATEVTILHAATDPMGIASWFAVRSPAAFHQPSLELIVLDGPVRISEVGAVLLIRADGEWRPIATLAKADSFYGDFPAAEGEIPLPQDAIWRPLHYSGYPTLVHTRAGDPMLLGLFLRSEEEGNVSLGFRVSDDPPIESSEAMLSRPRGSAAVLVSQRADPFALVAAEINRGCNSQSAACNGESTWSRGFGLSHDRATGEGGWQIDVPGPGLGVIDIIAQSTVSPVVYQASARAHGETLVRGSPGDPERDDPHVDLSTPSFYMISQGNESFSFEFDYQSGSSYPYWHRFMLLSATSSPAHLWGMDFVAWNERYADQSYPAEFVVWDG